MKLATVCAILMLTACGTKATTGVIPGGKPFELDERWLQPCPTAQKMPDLVNPNDVLHVRASDAAGESYCHASQREIVRSYRAYRKAMGASAPVASGAK